MYTQQHIYMELHPIAAQRSKHLIVAFNRGAIIVPHTLHSLRLYFHHCFLSFEFLLLSPRSPFVPFSRVFLLILFISNTL